MLEKCKEEGAKLPLNGFALEIVEPLDVREMLNAEEVSSNRVQQRRGKNPQVQKGRDIQSSTFTDYHTLIWLF